MYIYNPVVILVSSLLMQKYRFSFNRRDQVGQRRPGNNHPGSCWQSICSDPAAFLTCVEHVNLRSYLAGRSHQLKVTYWFTELELLFFPLITEGLDSVLYCVFNTGFRAAPPVAICHTVKAEQNEAWSEMVSI